MDIRLDGAEHGQRSVAAAWQTKVGHMWRAMTQLLNNMTKKYPQNFLRTVKTLPGKKDCVQMTSTLQKKSDRMCVHKHWHHT